MVDELLRTADVVVVGGGIAGASVAYELAEHRNVVLLEREATCGVHSTGRSAAVLTETTGPPVVRRLAAKSRAFLVDPPDGFAETPLTSPRQVLWVATAGEEHRLTDVTGEGTVVLSPCEARTLVRPLRECAVAAAVLERHGLDIDVAALLGGYLRGLRRRGGRLVTGALVDRLDRHRAGWRVRTSVGDVDTGTVVNAAGAWADHVAPRPIGLTALKRTAFTFRPPPDENVVGWPLIFDASGRWYMKPESSQLLGSPADETPAESGHVQAEELDVALGIDRLQAAFAFEIRTVSSTWAGLRTFAADRGPVAGPEPDDPSFVWLAGQGGYGIKVAPALAQLTAAAINGERPEDLAAVSPARFR